MVSMEKEVEDEEIKKAIENVGVTTGHYISFL